MGNSATKEHRPPTARIQPSDARQHLSSTGLGSDPSSLPPPPPPPDHDPSHSVYNERTGRGSRTDLSTMLGMRNGPPPDGPTLEGRRATKQEREARKLEAERVAREKERKRSMKEEHVDGGYLVTQGVYTGVEDYNKGVVRQLMIERRIAPFWRGLNDHSESWTENQLVAAARGKPVPAPDAIPEEEPRMATAWPSERGTSDAKTSLNGLTIPITSRSQSYNSDNSVTASPSQTSFPPGTSTVSQATPTSGSALFRGRSKTLAALTTSSKNQPADMAPREMQLPKDPYVSGQPLEAYLYKDASECPICFLYYPPYLNKTRCCDQAICSECFVQIKRPDPHPPEHADPSAPPPPPTDEGVDSEELMSEPAACPFCVQPEFGITYDPAPFRRGLTYVNHPSTHPLANASSAMSSASSLGSAISGRLSPAGSGRRRATSISATAPTVVTTDRVRPDWHHKLATARAHTARRSAAATALHTAAYLMGNRQESDHRPLVPFGRRGLLRRTSGGDIPAGSSAAQLNMLALMSERYAAANAMRAEEGDPSMVPGPRGSSRRTRVDDLEDMMMMEAVRLSLASEEERRKREEKDAKKEAKKKDKENRKADKAAEKAAKKAGVYPTSANQSSTRVNNGPGEVSTSQNDLASFNGKGKAVQQNNASDHVDGPSKINARATTTGNAQEHLERARAQLAPEDAALQSPYSSPAYRPSHLRNLSNVSSSASSMEGSNPAHGQTSSFEVSPNVSGIDMPSSVSAQDTLISGTPPGGGAGIEPMFNFRSLAAMVGDEDKSDSIKHEENASEAGMPAQPTGESSVNVSLGDNPEAQGIITRNNHNDYPTQICESAATQNSSRRENVELPGFKITSSSRVNSDLAKQSEDRKQASVGIENAPQGSAQAS